MRTFDGQDADGAHWYHAGLVHCYAEVLVRASRGLPVYLPRDARAIDQRPYLAFASKRGPNSE